MEFEEKTISRKEIYKGPIFQLVQDQVELPSGKGRAQRDLIFHNGAVCVLAVTPENKIVLVKQYRKAIEKVSYEIPAGKLEIGENAEPETAALRELEEEAAYTGKLSLLYDFYSSVGILILAIRVLCFKIFLLNSRALPLPAEFCIIMAA